MAFDPEAIKTGMPAAVPLVATLGLVYEVVEPKRAVLRLPDDARWHNHLGAPHAGAMFTLAESASGAVVLAAFSDLLDRATPLAAGAEITYLRLARGDVTAEATLQADPAAVAAEIKAGGLPQFPVEVELRDGSDKVTATMTVRWALKPHSRLAS